MTRIKRKFLTFKEYEAATASDYDINDLVTMFNRQFADLDADWFEEETRFNIGTLTVIVFKLTWLEEDDNKEAPKTEPVVETSHFLDPWDGYVVNNVETVYYDDSW